MSGSQTWLTKKLPASEPGGGWGESSENRGDDCESVVSRGAIKVTSKPGSAVDRGVGTSPHKWTSDEHLAGARDIGTSQYKWTDSEYRDVASYTRYESVQTDKRRVPGVNGYQGSASDIGTSPR